MNQGGEPGHDDDGLPRVDIEIPDDARELYRDVQAYHRELRALRRRQRSFRLRAPLRGPLRRGGFILPLVAGCLILALMSGIMLTVYSADPNFAGSRGSAGASPAASRSAGRPSAQQPSTNRPSTVRPSAGSTSAGTNSATAAPSQSVGARLPGKTISVAGQQVKLQTITSAALAIIPANCACTTAVQKLLAQAKLAMVTVYLVGPRGSRAGLIKLVGGSAPGNALVATDAANVLGAAYQTTGLTVLLVDSHGVVKVAERLGPGLDLERRLVLLKPTR